MIPERLLRRTVLKLVVSAVLAALLDADGAGILAQSPTSAPAAGAPTDKSASERIAHLQEIVKAHPGDTDALEALARADAELKDFPGAISAYGQVLAVNPSDRDAQVQLARLLGWNHQYEESIRAFRAVLDQVPGDREALEGLANVQVWSGKLTEAAATYGRLAAQHPEDSDYVLQAARLEAETRQYAAARDRLSSLLAVEPDNLDARLALAEVEAKQNQFPSALHQYERVLEERPRDPSALMGTAQMRYYTGDVAGAFAAASALVNQEPRNFDALFLLANIERARGHRAEARNLLNRADQISPHNPEVAELREKLWSESPTVLHLTAGYSRELGSPSGSGPLTEDLRSWVFGSQLDFSVLPHTSSILSFDALPTQTPSSAAVPSIFLYRQTTHLGSYLTLRGGLGLQRFGPGVPVELPNSAGPQPSATTAPIGFFGGSFAPDRRVSFDLTWSLSGVPYTPLAVQLGVISSRVEAGFNATFNPRTDFHLTYFREHLTTEPYQQLTGTTTGSGQPGTVYASEEEHGSGGNAVFNRRIVARERLNLDAGASALIFGYDGPRRGVYLGFFTPSFYQRELLNERLSGQFSKRLGYDFSASLGIQQVDQGQPIQRALIVNPAFTLKATPYLSGSLGYAYYNSAQGLGIVSGNGVRLTIDWRF